MQLLVSSFAITLLPIARVTDPCTDLVTMYSRMGAANSYTQTKIAPGGPTVKTEFVAPDRLRTDNDGHQSISIGNKSWTNLGGHWYGGSGSHAFESEIQIWKAAADNGTLLQSCRSADVVDLGLVNGLHVYHMNAPKFGVQNVIYLQADSLPVRIETTTRGKTYITTYEWNAPITINAPE
ncbi:MAG: hypothetical protein M3126_01830 [Candidatus Eremiobacteraeota bacterium]|nr:hypothetical protein [Candidatus Eremiobacteraeota bacterium]